MNCPHAKRQHTETKLKLQQQVHEDISVYMAGKDDLDVF